MKKPILSREQLVAAAGEIAEAQGLAGLDIRGLANKCGIAVGTVYRYFPSKAELVAAVIEDFWRQIADMGLLAPGAGEAFPAYVARLYGFLALRLSSFRSDWLSQIAALGPEERQEGRRLEARCFSHIKEALLRALPCACQDSSGDSAPSPFLDSQEEREALAGFTFDHMLFLLRQGEKDCAYLSRVLEALLASPPQIEHEPTNRNGGN